jgi:hypothetical protein
LFSISNPEGNMVYKYNKETYRMLKFFQRLVFVAVRLAFVGNVSNIINDTSFINEKFIMNHYNLKATLNYN